MSEPRVERGFRPATRSRKAILCFRVVDGPFGMKDGWRDSNGKQMKCQEDIEAVEAWTNGQIALLPSYQRSIVREDRNLLRRAQESDDGGRPIQRSQQPTQISPETQRLIDQRRREESTVDSVLIAGRHLYGCRIPD